MLTRRGRSSETTGGVLGAQIGAAQDPCDRLLRQIMDARLQSDRTQLHVLWREFEKAFAEDLALEERILVPALLASRERDGRAILAEHQHLRRRVVELGQSFARGDERASALHGFIEERRAHEQREEPLYEWFEARNADDANDEAPKNELAISAAALRVPAPARRL